MTKLTQLLAVAALTGLTFQITAHAEKKEGAAAPKEAKAKPYPLDFCLISGEKFEGSDMKPFEIVHEGQTIKFCCKSCVKDFKKDPKKELAKLADEVKKQKSKAAQ